MKILLAEADPGVGQRLKQLLISERYLVDWVVDGAVAAELAMTGEYDLLLINLNLPRINGLRICHQVRTHNLAIPILMLSAVDSDQELINVLNSGADDLVHQQRDPHCVIAKIHALLRRLNHLKSANTLLTWGALTFDVTLMQVSYKQRNVVLSPLEYRLLELFLSHQNYLFSRHHIIDRIWPIDHSPSEATVTNLVKDLRRKLRAAGMKEEFIRTVHGMGYRVISYSEEAGSSGSTVSACLTLKTANSWPAGRRTATSYRHSHV